MLLVQVRTGTRYGLEILHKCGKKVQIVSQKILGSNSYVCTSRSGKTGRGDSSAKGPNLFKNFHKVEI